jgi:two-component system, chemotaxis family, chemotaxis protein CheY
MSGNFCCTGKPNQCYLRENKMSLDPNSPILVVDDYKTMVKIVRHLLGQLGYKNIDDASNGAEAFEKMQSKKYGLVISDWNMEPMTGYALLQKMRASDHHADTPFISQQPARPVWIIT